MLVGLLNRVFTRLNYEVERGRKLLPTLIRLGFSQAEDLYQRFSLWRGTCDHVQERRRGRKGGKRPKVKVKRR